MSLLIDTQHMHTVASRADYPYVDVPVFSKEDLSISEFLKLEDHETRYILYYDIVSYRYYHIITAC